MSMMSTIKSQFKGADICINNAGLGYDEPLLTGDTEKWRHVLEVSQSAVKHTVRQEIFVDKNFRGFR